MSKKNKRPKRTFPKKMASDYIDTSQRIDWERLGTYHERVRSVTGPKNNMELVQGNTFTRPIVDDKVCVIYCSCGKGPFTFTQDFQIHVKDAFRPKNPKALANTEAHDPEFVPEERKSHTDDATGALVAHAFIVIEDTVLDDQGNPKIEKNRLPKQMVNRRRFEVIQSTTRVKINELPYIKVGTYKLHFSSSKEEWTFEHSDGRTSSSYISQARALLAYETKRINWNKI